MSCALSFNNVTEQVESVAASVRGHIPEWLNGSLIRAGPGFFDFDHFSVNHWFDGLAFVYKFSIEEGKVRFSKRYIHSEAYKKAKLAGKTVYAEFGTKSSSDPTKSIFSRMLSTFDPSCITDNTIGNVIPVDSDVYVAGETCYLRKLNPYDLETQDKVDLNKVLGVNFATAHPLVDETGTLYNVATSFTTGPKYHIFKVPPGQGDSWNKSKVLATLNASWKTNYSYIHSFGMSQNYLVLLEQPLLVNTFNLATATVKGRNLHECTEWHPDEMVRFHLIRKSTGEVLKTKYIADDPFFVLHHVNAYEVKDQIVVDLIRYDSPEMLNKFYLNKLRTLGYGEGHLPQLVRFVLPLLNDLKDVPLNEELVRVPSCTASAHHIKDHHMGDHIVLSAMPIGDAGADMPKINPEYTCRPYRFVYASGGYETGAYHHAVCKVDVETGHVLTWGVGESQYLGEPMFVKDPNGTEEDDGVILVALEETRSDQQDALVVLSAKDFSEMGRGYIPSKLPAALHGVFLNDRL